MLRQMEFLWFMEFSSKRGLSLLSFHRLYWLHLTCLDVYRGLLRWFKATKNLSNTHTHTQPTHTHNQHTHTHQNLFKFSENVSMGYSKAEPQWIPNLKFYSHFSPVPTGKWLKNWEVCKPKTWLYWKFSNFFKKIFFQSVFGIRKIRTYGTFSGRTTAMDYSFCDSRNLTIKARHFLCHFSKTRFRYILTPSISERNFRFGIHFCKALL